MKTIPVFVAIAALLLLVLPLRAQQCSGEDDVICVAVLEVGHAEVDGDTPSGEWESRARLGDLLADTTQEARGRASAFYSCPDETLYVLADLDNDQFGTDDHKWNYVAVDGWPIVNGYDTVNLAAPLDTSRELRWVSRDGYIDGWEARAPLAQGEYTLTVGVLIDAWPPTATLELRVLAVCDNAVYLPLVGAGKEGAQ